MSRERAVVACGLLVVSSVYCLRRCHILARYARAAFRLNIATGFFGVIYYGATSVEHTTEIYQVVWTWSYCLGLPLLASDLMVYCGIPLNMAPLNLIIPCYSLIEYHVGQGTLDMDLLKASHYSSIMAMLFVAIIGERATAYGTAFFYAIAFTNVGLNDVEDSAATALWALLAAMGNLYILPALTLDL